MASNTSTPKVFNRLDLVELMRTMDDKDTWAIYNGLHSRLNGKPLLASHTQSTGIEDAISTLVGQLRLIGKQGGKFTIHQRKDNNSNGRIIWADLPPDLSTPEGQQFMQRQGGMAGIGNMPGMGMYPQMSGIGMVSKQEMKSEVAAAVAAAKKEFQKDKEIEELRVEIAGIREESRTKGDVLFDRAMQVLENPAGGNIIAGLIDRILPGQGAATVAGLKGFAKDVEDEHEQQTEETTDAVNSNQNTDSGQMSEHKVEELDKYLEEIDKVIPLEEVLPKIANWVKGKSATEIRTYLNLMK